MKHKDNKKFIKKCLKYREFNVPIIHLTSFISNNEYQVILKLLDIFEEAGTPFCLIEYNKTLDCIEIKFFGFISKSEKKRIIKEIKNIYNGELINILD